MVRRSLRSVNVDAHREHERDWRGGSYGAGGCGSPASMDAIGNNRLLRPVLGQPAAAVPASTVGTLHGVNLATGDIVWQVPLGDVPALAAKGIVGTGAPKLGGAIVTEAGLAFIGGAGDSRLRAFDLRTVANSGAATAGERSRDANDLPRGAIGPTVRRHCRRWRRTVLESDLGRVRCVCLARPHGSSGARPEPVGHP